MLSRVANSIYWMSRYLERADNVARFIDVNMRLNMELESDTISPQWEPLVRTSGDDEDFVKRYKVADEINVVRFLTFDKKNVNSIISCINAARENARVVREIIPVEVWETINELYHLVQKQSRRNALEDLQPFYHQIKQANYLVTGLIENIMTNDNGKRFLNVGRMLERADKTARILDVKYFLLLPNTEQVDSPYDAVQWGAVLQSVDAFQMYRRHFHRVNYRDVSSFLIFDKLFPRSMMYCIQKAMSCLQEITTTLDIDANALQEIQTLKEMLENTEINTVLANGLHEFIDIFQFNLNIVDQSIFESFFALKL